MVRKGVGVFLYHTRKVRETCINVVAFNDGGPELGVSLIQGKVSGKWSLLGCAVLAPVLTKS